MHATWRRMCAHVNACVSASVISGLSILFRIYANPLSTLFLSYEIIFLFYFYGGDVAQHKVSDSLI